MAQDQDSPVMRRIKDDALRRVVRAAAPVSNLWIEEKTLPRGHVIEAQHQRIPLERSTVVVFADDAPLHNWAHPCRYLLYRADDGQLYREVAAHFPPYLVEAPATFRLVHQSTLTPHHQLVWRLRPDLTAIVARPAAARYAVLFSGASNNRHTNDLEFLYRTLRDRYSFRADSIYVLNYDGTINYSGGPQPATQWPGNSTSYRMPVHGKGTKTDLEGVFDDLKPRLKPDDLLLVHCNNHGGHNGTESYLCTHSGPGYTAGAFADKLAELPKFGCLIAMMEQCHSGGFNAPILARSPAAQTSVASACGELASSIGGPEFDPFARDWIAALRGFSPHGAALAFDPDTSGDGVVASREAFHYAEVVKDPYDTPVFSDSSPAAALCRLGRTFIIPRWYESLLLDLRPHWERLAEPLFYERVEKELLPRLDAIESSMDPRLSKLRKDLERRSQEAVKEAFGPP